jgi:hypothetical protein
MSRKVSLFKVGTTLSIISLTASPGISQAADVYAGLDLVKMKSELSVVPSNARSVSFDTTHLRLKGGVEVMSWLAYRSPDNTQWGRY